jgi:hypothetical protein
MSVLFEVRSRLSDLNVNELQVADNQPALVEMWREMQTCKAEMNLAITEAIALAAKPYRLRLQELEKRYAILLRLSA